MISLNDVLLAMSNIPVDDPIAEIWGRGLQGGYKIIEYTGSLPIIINANGNALLDYRIYGNTVQDDTPTPENPVDVVGCGERTENIETLTANKLIFTNGSYTTIEYTETGINIIISGYAANFSIFSLKSITSDMIGESFAVSWTGDDNTACEIGLWDYEIAINNKFVEITRGARVITITNDMVGKDIAVRFFFSNAGTYAISNFMFTAGSTAPTSYIPYGYKLPILSNSTVTNVYLGEVETTRRIKKLVLTGEENWIHSQYTTHDAFITNAGYVPTSPTDCICTHYKTAWANTNNTIYFFAALDGQFVILDDRFNNDNDFKSYLAAQYAAGTPVIIWYVLAEPETIVVNEPLMKIGDYSDTVSMEQAGVSIPTSADETTIDYDGEPKPSQMYVKHKGKE